MQFSCYNKECPASNKNNLCMTGNGICQSRIISDINKEYEHITRIDGLTEQEGKVMDALVDAWNEFIKLGVTHPTEETDFMDGIHQCQNTLCMRILRRDYLKSYPTYNK